VKVDQFCEVECCTCFFSSKQILHYTTFQLCSTKENWFHTGTALCCLPPEFWWSLSSHNPTKPGSSWSPSASTASPVQRTQIFKTRHEPAPGDHAGGAAAAALSPTASHPQPEQVRHRQSDACARRTRNRQAKEGRLPPHQARLPLLPMEGANSPSPHSFSFSPSAPVAVSVTSWLRARCSSRDLAPRPPIRHLACETRKSNLEILVAPSAPQPHTYPISRFLSGRRTGGTMLPARRGSRGTASATSRTTSPASTN
jgi:hypothetical protein